MIILIHTEGIINEVIGLPEDKPGFGQRYCGIKLQKCLSKLGTEFPNQLLVWVRNDWKDWLNIEELPDLVPHSLVMISFRDNGDFFENRLDYLDFSTSIKVAQGVRYPTWKMSASVGAGFGILFSAIEEETGGERNTDYFLCKISKNLQPIGLLSYREPRLLKKGYPKIEEGSCSVFTQFQFARKEIALQWAFFLFLSILIYEKKFALFPLLFSIFYKSSKFNHVDIRGLRPNQKGIPDSHLIDVLIPTLGREKYVHQVLKDLSQQSLLPSSVIIIEQESDPGQGSQMPFLKSEEWPFEIKHVVTTQRGPCMARNLGLDLVSSDWVFLADDDIRLEPHILESILIQMNTMSVEAATVSCLLEGQMEPNEHIHQTRIFGAGCSMVKRSVLEKVRFDEAYEFGYAEDSDFGAQIRNLGHDVVYLPSPTILHLKAPMGGFRSKIEFPWSKDFPHLKPSPTVMLFWMRHFTYNQFNGNQLMLFFKLFQKNGLKNPFWFFKNFRVQWNISLDLAKRLDSGELKTKWNGVG